MDHRGAILVLEERSERARRYNKHMFDDLRERGETIEECYEFMLAYAAQGLPSDEGSRTGGQVREFLGRAVKAMDGLAESFAALIEQEGLEPAAKYRAFLAVLDRDARDSLAALSWFWPNPSSVLS